MAPGGAAGTAGDGFRRGRLRACVEAWPDAETGAYDPRCCRFPKSCSATVYDPEHVAAADLEPAAPVVRGEDAAGGELREESIDLTPGVVWTDAQLAVVRALLVRATRAEAERDQAHAKVARVEAEHRPEQIEDVGPEGPVAIAICVADHDYWPCDVRRALDGEVDRG